MQNTKNALRWGKTEERAVSPIIATILLVAITVVLAAVLYVLVIGFTHGGGTATLGTALAMGSAAESGLTTCKLSGYGTFTMNAAPPACAASGANYFYNFTPSSASSLTLSQLSFSVQTSTGGVVVLPAASADIYIQNAISGNVVGEYNGGAWSAHTVSSTSFTTQDVVVLVTTQNLVGAGDNLVISGSGSYSGSVTAPIP